MGGQKDLQNLHTESDEEEADEEDYVVERVVKKRISNGVVSKKKMEKFMLEMDGT